MKSIPIFGNYQKFPKKNLAGKICLSPFVSATILAKGKVRLCACGGWQPTTVGNIFEQPLIEILNNSLSKEIRQTIVDGTYEFCDADKCGIINNNQLNDINSLDNITLEKINGKIGLPREIFMSGDLTCNLSCPSCRTKIYKPTPKQVAHQIELGQKISNNCFSQASNEHILLTLSTTGELFASPMLLSFLATINLDNFPNLKLHIQTNALLAKSKWKKLGLFQNRIKRITVTFDATEKQTYEEIRRGGRWEDLIENLEFLKSKKKEMQFEYHSRMVVQQKNYNQMLEFYHMSKNFDFDRVEYGRLQNWYTWNLEEFKQHDVFSPLHLEYKQARHNYSEVLKLPNTMFFGGFAIDRA